jgi:hypothetical protein
MSLRSLISDREDHELKRAIRNAFALLPNMDIQHVCSALADTDPGAAAAMIIELVGPESDRVAAILPTLWEPGTLSDPEIASAVVVGAAKMKGTEKPTKDDVRKALGALALPPQDTKAASDTLQNVAESAVTWGLTFRLLGDVALSLLSRKLIALRVASRIPFLAKTAATLGGVIFGAERALPLPPVGSE